ncbi:hypothetical protein B0O99DRAFT_681758 [Bisporella sp. PMI_857]|nr:hypothetical protein B0O99DRAFT_681758 [Bisporella sp. PMI_857]
MVTVWNESVVYWTGVVALLAQAYLQVGSLSWVQARYYEFFKVTHFIAALVFAIFFFLHCDFRLSSCVPVARAADGKSKSKLVFYVHSKGGLTGRLAKAAVAQPGYRAPVLLDGPYGGVRGNPLSSYDQHLIITCGSGAALSLGFVMEFALRGGSVPSPQIGEKIRSMRVIIATRDPLLSEWYEEVLLNCMEDNGIADLSDNLRINVCLTGPNRSTENSSSGVERKGGISSEPTRVAGFLAKFTGRPIIATVVKETALQPGISVGIVACGPSGVLEETQSEAAAAQLRILKSAPGACGVYLHTELFS